MSIKFFCMSVFKNTSININADFVIHIIQMKDLCSYIRTCLFFPSDLVFHLLLILQTKKCRNNEPSFDESRFPHLIMVSRLSPLGHSSYQKGGCDGNSLFLLCTKLANIIHPPHDKKYNINFEYYSFAMHSIHEEQLRVFLEDPEIPLDNNDAKRIVRSFCVGKHSWHIIDSKNGAV